jgi:2-methylisocitrate lyase-like PEP mutase family enzyme
MTTPTTDRVARFLDLHRKGEPLLLANAWDIGTARILEALGYAAIATTSAGHAGSLGRPDGAVRRDEALAHAAELSRATALPVNADLEGGFAAEPARAAETYRLASEAGIAGASIEDSTGDPDAPIHPAELAAERVRAAAEAAHAGAGLVLTARSENFLHGRPDLKDTITRLQAFQEAGADVLYAPGIASIEDVREVVRSVDRPVNVLCLPHGPAVADLAQAGVARISVGSGFYHVAMSALVAAAREWKEEGTHGFWSGAIAGMGTTKSALR